MKKSILLLPALLLIIVTSAFGQTNKAPVVSVPGSQSVMTGQTLSFTVSGSDPNAGQTLVFKASGLPSGATFSQTSPTQAQFNWTPTGTQTQTYTVSVKAVDNGSPSLTSSTKNIVIIVKNRAPVLIVPGEQSVAAGQPLRFIVTATDADAGQTLNFTAQQLPSLASFSKISPTQGEFKWIPTPDQKGPYTVKINVADNGSPSQTDTGTVKITIKKNSSPALTVPGTLTGTAGQPLSFTVSAVDANDGQTLKFTAAGLPTGASFSRRGASQAQFSWTPSGTQTGTYTITTKVEDGGSPTLSDTKSIRIVINNRSPEIVAPNTLTMMAGSLLKFAVDTSDADQGQSLQFTTSTLPQGATLRKIGTTRFEFSWTPTAAQIGTHNIVFTAKDNGSPVLKKDVSVQLKIMNLSQWVKVNGLKGLVNKVKNLQLIGGNLLALTNSGIFLSANNGDSWIPTGRGGLPDGEAISEFAVSGSNLFASIGSRIFRSSDSGQNWTLASSGLPDSPIIGIAASNSAVLIKTYDKVFLSTNNGENWKQVFTGGAEFLAINGSTLYVASQPFLCQSGNNGEIWKCTRLGPFYPVLVGALAVKGNMLIAAGCVLSGPVLSTDSGESWKEIAFPAKCINDFAPVGSDLLFANSLEPYSFSQGVWMTTNFGQSWMTTNFNPSWLSAKIIRLLKRENMLLAMSENGEIYRLTITGSY